jgi:tRNA nucleotidyltransferase (CCA-adding enzyme)
MARWEHFHHVADIGIRGFGDTLEAAFEQAALALTGVVTDPALVRPTGARRLSLMDPDPELLLYGWLNRIIYLMATERWLFGRFRVRIHEQTLDADLWGEPVDVRRHHPAVEVKGATFTELAVRKHPAGGWLAQCVVDV